MLRSLVIPLEEEIKALKDKLRATDDQLQRCIQCGHNTDTVEVIRRQGNTLNLCLYSLLTVAEL